MKKINFIAINCFLIKILIFINVFCLVKADDKTDDDIKFKEILTEEQKSIKVSIIIPAYNVAEYIERSITSALNQTLKEIEVIVVNDGSTDNTLEVLKKFENDKRFKYISMSQNQGLGITRNVGMAIAVGEYIGFIDGDDYVDVNYFENLYKQSKGIDVVVGVYVLFTNTENFINHEWEVPKLHGASWDSIWRREFLNKNNIKCLRVNVGEDIEFRRLAYKYNPRILQTIDEGIYYYYRIRKGSLTNFNQNWINDINKKIEEKYKLKKKTKAREKEKKP